MPRTAVSIDGYAVISSTAGGGSPASSLRQQRHAVLIGQVDVAQHEIEAAARDRGDRAGGRVDRLDLVAGARRARREHSARMPRSSSTTRMLLTIALGITTPELGATAVRAVADLDRAAGGRDEVLAHREAEAGADARAPSS